MSACVSIADYTLSSNLSHRPSGCSMEIYNIMSKCHSFKADQRPSFSEILFLLPSLHQTNSESYVLESSSDSESYCDA